MEPQECGLLHIQHGLIDETPSPGLARLEAPHDRVPGAVKVFRSVLAYRRVATPHMSALQAQTQVDPFLTDLQTLLTPV